MNCMLLSTVQHGQRQKIQSDDRKSNDTFGDVDCFFNGTPVALEHSLTFWIHLRVRVEVVSNTRRENYGLSQYPMPPD